jgi:hypothetical protein
VDKKEFRKRKKSKQKKNNMKWLTIRHDLLRTIKKKNEQEIYNTLFILIYIYFNKKFTYISIYIFILYSL